LFLPCVNYRKSDSQKAGNLQAAYWTATLGAKPVNNRIDFLTKAYAFTFNFSPSGAEISPIDKASGVAIRCIAE
jgi:hypothetical protein